MGTLSEHRSKEVLAGLDLPLVPHELVTDPADAAGALERLGAPVAMKLCGDGLAHKSERGLVRLGVAGAEEAHDAAVELLGLAVPEDGRVEVLIAPMVVGRRELIVGLATDAGFGPKVLLGSGGVLAEALGEVVVRLAPIDLATAHDMIDELPNQALLDPARGEVAADRGALAQLLVTVSEIPRRTPGIVAVDLNPVVLRGTDGAPIAVDALVELDPSGHDLVDPTPHSPDPAAWSALLDPRGVVVAGASTHPGKFGFVALHNVLACGYEGTVSASNLEGAEVLGVATVADVAELPEGAADLVVVCTPLAAVEGVLRSCAGRGVKAAVVTTAGYAESGERGRVAQAALAALAQELGVLLIGPNVQGIVSTPSRLCAQIVAPYPPTGPIGIASQSGNIVSSLMNLAGAGGVGVSRAISVGNAATTGVEEVVAALADDAATEVVVAYLEGLSNPRSFFATVGRASRRLPVVAVRGGSSEQGAKAAVSHTGSLATDSRTFEGAARQAGMVLAPTIADAYEAAATFASQPLPPGPRTCIVTTAGGWGVLAADAVSRSENLRLAELPEELLSQLDELLPSRWSRGNPVDLAGGETRDTIPAVLDLVVASPEVDAVVVLGLGIQSNQARLEQLGPFFPDHGLERIVSYHRRQDRRFASHAAEVSVVEGKPVLVATELAVADPDNPAVAACRDAGRLCYPSAERAVAALDRVAGYARWLKWDGGDR